MSIDQIFLLVITSLATSFAAGVTGIGWGMTMLALMYLFVPHPLIIPIHGIKQFFSEFFVFAYLLQYLHLRTACYFLLGIIPGAVLGYHLLSMITSNRIFMLALVVMMLITAIKPKFSPAIKLSSFGFTILGLVATALAPIIGAISPLLTPFFMRLNFKRQTFVSTKSFCQMAVHLSKIPVFWASDFPYGLYDIPIMAVIISSYFGTVLGVNVLHKINQKTFNILLRVIMLMMGVAMLWKFI